MSLAEVLTLPCNLYSQFYEAMGIIGAEERLVGMGISAYPHVKDGKRDRMFRETQRKANPNHLVKRTSESIEAFFSGE